MPSPCRTIQLQRSSPHLSLVLPAVILLTLSFTARLAHGQSLPAVCIDLGHSVKKEAVERQLDALARQTETLLARSSQRVVIHLTPRGDGSQAYHLARSSEIAERLRNKLLAAKLPQRQIRFHWAYEAESEPHSEQAGSEACERLPTLAVSLEASAS